MLDDTIIISFGKDDITSVKLTRGKTTQTKFGALKHDDVIGKKIGSKVSLMI